MAIKDTTVKILLSTMAGAPSIPNSNAGSLMPTLDACLVDGFGTVTIDDLTVADDVATAFVSTGHGFGMIGSDPYVGAVIEISGASYAAMNREWRISSTPDGNTFTFDVQNIPDGVITGSIVAKRASFGWTKPFSGVNKAVYRNNPITGTGTYLRISNESNSHARPTLYREMIDIDNGLYASGTPYWTFSTSTADTPWVMIGDDRAVYFLFWSSSGGSTSRRFNYFCGDLVNSALQMDTTNCLLLGNDGTSTYQKSNLIRADDEDNNRRYIAGAADQISTSDALLWAHRGVGYYSGQSGIYSFSNFSESPIILSQRSVESQDTHRGFLPGLYDSLSRISGQSDMKTFKFTNDGAHIMAIKQLDYWGGTAALVFDIEGSWR
jgi:hypothetical protein